MVLRQESTARYRWDVATECIDWSAAQKKAKKMVSRRSSMGDRCSRIPIIFYMNALIVIGVIVGGIVFAAALAALLIWLAIKFGD